MFDGNALVVLSSVPLSFCNNSFSSFKPISFKSAKVSGFINDLTPRNGEQRIPLRTRREQYEKRREEKKTDTNLEYLVLE